MTGAEYLKASVVERRQIVDLLLANRQLVLADHLDDSPSCESAISFTTEV